MAPMVPRWASRGQSSAVRRRNRKGPKTMRTTASAASARGSTLRSRKPPTWASASFLSRPRAASLSNAGDVVIVIVPFAPTDPDAEPGPDPGTPDVEPDPPDPPLPLTPPVDDPPEPPVEPPVPPPPPPLYGAHGT